jgi:hypothetical protein
MAEKKNRFVWLCHQLLAVGTVAALAAPAAGVVSLEIVEPQVGATAPVALVASAPVEPEVTEQPLRGVEEAGLDVLARRPAARQRAADELAALSAPEKVDGLATVGVTWSAGERLGEDEVSVSVRSFDHGRWSGWQEIEYHDDHGPDPDSVEGRNARQGTEPIVVGDVDEVQVKVETATGEVPNGARLAVVDPQESVSATLEPAAIDTARLSGETSGPSGDGDLSLSAATDTGEVGVTPKPRVFSRAQWGADERLRDRSSLAYHEVHAGFVHHTVNANSYTRAQVPALIRGIYAYHTKSRGWSDIGYNFIVDRFGRIWEGRYGGVDRPVVGAHTLGYNEYSFAMSALGNFDQARPSAATLDAYGRLFAWKLSLHGVSASSPQQWVGKRTFPAINGHRDAGQTACPGRHLYARIGTIRDLAAGYQAPFTGRVRTTDLAGSPWPDVLVRDKATKRVQMVRLGGQTNFKRAWAGPFTWRSKDLLTAAGDLDRDGLPDLVARDRASGLTTVHPGTSAGGFGDAITQTDRFRGADQLAGAGDLNGDGRADLVARIAGQPVLWLYPGNGSGGFGGPRRLSGDWGDYDLTARAGDLDGDGRDDLLARAGRRLFLVPGRARGLGTPTELPGAYGHYSLIAGGGDLTGDGHDDVLAKARGNRLVFIHPGDGHGGFGPRLGPFGQFKGLDFLAPAGHLVGDPTTDLVGRNGRGRLLVFAHNGARNLESIVDTGLRLPAADLLLNVGDWNGDNAGDLMMRTRRGVLQLRPGDGAGRFGKPVRVAAGWRDVDLVAAVGDITGDGHPDLMGQPRGRAMRIYPGDGAAGLLPSYVAHSSIRSNRHAGLGLWDADGSPDSLLRRADGTLQIYRGNGPGGLMSPVRVTPSAKIYDWIVSVGDTTGDGRPDVLARHARNGQLWLLPGTPKGFGARMLVTTGLGGYDLST